MIEEAVIGNHENIKKLVIVVEALTHKILALEKKVLEESK